MFTYTMNNQKEAPLWQIGGTCQKSFTMQQPCMGEKPSLRMHRGLTLSQPINAILREEALLDHKAHTVLFQCDVKTGKVTYGTSVAPDIQECQVGQAGQPVVQRSKEVPTEAIEREAAERGELAQEGSCEVEVADIQSMQTGAVAQLFESCKKKAQGCQDPPYALVSVWRCEICSC